MLILPESKAGASSARDTEHVGLSRRSFAKTERDKDVCGIPVTVEMSKERGRLARVFHHPAGEPPALR